MRNLTIIGLLILVSSGCQLPIRGLARQELPDDYLPFTLTRLDDKLEGASPYLDGFTITMDIPQGQWGDGLSREALFAFVRSQKSTGTLTYPNGKTTPIEYEIVHHRGPEEIYMKTTLGYFLWEYISVEGHTLDMAIYWWYCPPATEVDLEILEMAATLLADSSHWHQEDDRQCEDDIESNRWSLFCALKHASLEKTGEYNHHNTAMQTVRFVIDEILPDHGFAHTLMDYNNAPVTTHRDIMQVLELAEIRIRQDISGRGEG